MQLKIVNHLILHPSFNALNMALADTSSDGWHWIDRSDRSVVWLFINPLLKCNEM